MTPCVISVVRHRRQGELTATERPPLSGGPMDTTNPAPPLSGAPIPAGAGDGKEHEIRRHARTLPVFIQTCQVACPENVAIRQSGSWIDCPCPATARTRLAGRVRVDCTLPWSRNAFVVRELPEGEIRSGHTRDRRQASRTGRTARDFSWRGRTNGAGMANALLDCACGQPGIITTGLSAQPHREDRRTAGPAPARPDGQRASDRSCLPCAARSAASTKQTAAWPG